MGASSWSGPTTAIAVVGMGAVLPGAASTDALWPIVARGQDMARDVPRARWMLGPDEAWSSQRPAPDRVYAKRACLVDDDVALDFTGLDLDPAFVASLDPSVHLLLHAGAGAWRQARTESVERRRAGVVIGNIVLPTDGASALSDWIVGRELQRRVFAGAGVAEPTRAGAPPAAWNRWVAGLPAGVLAQGLGLGGDHTSLDAACASSLFALHLAAAALRRGEADIMLAGGLSRPSSLYTQMGFSQLRALSPTGRCSPFDRRGDGLLVGEGAGILVLKRLADAQRDGDRIWAVIRGTGLSNDLDGNLLAPSSEGQLRAMRTAYAQAGWAPGDVDLIECHATGTPVGDAVEIASIAALVDDARGRRPYLGAVKANVGHLLTGAGAAALIKAILAMDRRVIPPVANFETLSPRIDLARAPVIIPTQAVPWPTGRAPRAAVSGFGFGGTNAHVVLEHPDGIAASKTMVQVPRAVPEPAIAIVGMAAHIGPWTSLSAIRERLFSEAPDASAPNVALGGLPGAHAGWFIEALDVPLGVFRIPPNELAALLPQQLLALEVARQARADVQGTVPQGERVGVFLGVELDFGTTDYHLRWAVRSRAVRWAELLGRPSAGPAFEQWVDALCDALGPALDADRTMGGLASIAASRIAREFRWGGPSYALCTEDTSGMAALITATRSLQAGEIDAAFVGAVDLGGDVRARIAHAAVRNEVVDGRPADATSSGVTPSEGAVGVVLKRLDDARRDGDRVYAVVAGAATVTGGRIAEGGPTADTHRRCAAQACADAGDVAIAAIDTAVGGVPSWDAAELRGLSAVAGDAPRVATKAAFGDAGAASGLLALVATALRMHHRLLEPVRGLQHPLAALGRPLRGLQPWLTDRHAGPAHALVAAASVTGHVAHVVLRQADAQPWTRPPREALFVVEADEVTALGHGLTRLASVAVDAGERSLQDIARGWHKERGRDPQAKLAVALIARDTPHLATLAREAAEDLAQCGDAGRRGGANVCFAAQPLAGPGAVAFVFPGSGSHFPGMGRALALDAPAALWAQHERLEHLANQIRPALSWNASQAEMDSDPRGLILAQVSMGTLASDALRQFGVQPDAVIGYSLGETTGLFSLGAWRDRDAMLGRVFDGELFTQELAGACRAAARTWGLDAGTPVAWRLGVVEASSASVDAALVGRARVYRLIVNTPHACVVGGDAEALADLVRDLAVPFHPIPGVTTVHCEVAGCVADAYRALHRLPTTPPDGVRFYSGAWGHAYDVSTDTAAAAVTDQAIVGVDFPKVVRQAYDDGVRIFVELGPGGSCTRMITEILDDRPFAARSVSSPSREGRAAWLRTLAMLVAHRVPVDLSPLVPPNEAKVSRGGSSLRVAVGRAPLGPLPAAVAPAETIAVRSESPRLHGPIVGAASATAAAHAAFLDASASITQIALSQLQTQFALLRAGAIQAPVSIDTPPRALNRAQCLAFARGGIAEVLGPRFAAVDAFPTRVRLPDEPLMLVDRITQIDAEPGSMTHGRVVTEHDVLPHAWYLDAGKIPTCVAVEAGQADLFLSAYLGIDLQTRGLAVYRLLDATVTFHDHLPQVGATIRYDIAIERFFRQGDTWLFRFGFEATVDGVPLMTMQDGCAGFFSADELAAGKGVVDARLAQARARPCSPLAERPTFVTPRAYTLDAAQLDALRSGDLQAAFGPEWRALPVRRPLTIPGDRMRLVHRITELAPEGGEHGLGFVRGEADIAPDDWFITCHFVDDPVMPGTLMYECCMHTLRVFLLSLGWVGESDAVAFEPKPGVHSRLKCRGQVLQDTRVVTYEVTMRQFGHDPEPWVICDARMYADGKRIVDIEDMSARLTGSDAARLAAQAQRAPAHVYDKASLEAFAYGKPSEAFGAPYEVFDGPHRAIARLPGAPFQFIDRVPEAHGTPFVMQAGARCRAEVDRDTWAWTLLANRQAAMPFAVLLEIGLQACGWLAAYVGSALTSQTDVHFRNLGGRATLHRAVTPQDEGLVMHAALTSVSASGGMIIQHFDFAVHGRDGSPVYDGTTYFGFFSAAALADQVGIRDAKRYTPTPAELSRARTLDVPRTAPMPDDRFRMVDRIDALVPDGGSHGLGFITGSIDVDPSAWFFRAHFHQDPVWPGSLGLEAFVQLLKVFALDRWDVGAEASFSTAPVGHAHEWVYRGQVVPSCKRVQVQAEIVECNDATHRLVANGFLVVDGRPIYEMKQFALELLP